VRLDIRKTGVVKNGELPVGNKARVKVVKNKVAPPFREAEFEIMYGQGISREGEIIELASAQGIVEKSGAWYAYKGNRIGQGKDNARTFLQQNKEVAREIEDLVRAKLLPVKQQRNGDQANTA
jgi:recombination protein RecA